jgi:hypothetical protein
MTFKGEKWKLYHLLFTNKSLLIRTIQNYRCIFLHKLMIKLVNYLHNLNKITTTFKLTSSFFGITSNYIGESTYKEEDKKTVKSIIFVSPDSSNT